MIIYLVCQDIDLGYHVLEAFSDREKGEKRLDELIKYHYDEGYKWEPKLFIEEIELK